MLAVEGHTNDLFDLFLSVVLLRILRHNKEFSLSILRCKQSSKKSYMRVCMIYIYIYYHR